MTEPSEAYKERAREMFSRDCPHPVSQTKYMRTLKHQCSSCIATALQAADKEGGIATAEAAMTALIKNLPECERDIQNAALEEAAKAADTKLMGIEATAPKGHSDFVRREVGAAIRALIEKVEIPKAEGEAS